MCDNFYNNFDFNISKNFINPLFPKTGDNVVVNFLGSSLSNKIFFNYKKNGNWISKEVWSAPNLVDTLGATAS